MTGPSAEPATRTIELDLAELDDTLALGAALGRALRAGDVLILTGSLGAGKTTLTKGIATGLGVTGTVLSPTFVLARVHRPGPGAAPTAVPLVHVDAYRLGGALELDDLDLDTDLARSAVVVEWGEGVADQLADDRLVIALERRPDDTRRATLTGLGTWAQRLPDVVEGARARG